MADLKCDLQFAVLGLGRFGMGVVRTLAEYDVNILACDKNAEVLHEATEYATQVVQADAADEDAMRRVGLGNFDVVILAMGEDFEASVMATMTAKELGAGRIIAKAIGPKQKKILLSVGASRVVLPEVEMGARVARNLVHPNVLDALEQSGHFAVSEMYPEADWVGKTVGSSSIRSQTGYSILAVLRESGPVIPVPPSLVLEKTDLLIVLQEQTEPK